MNLYEKLNAAKTELYGKGLKKSGLNSYSGYDYFELTDFLPEIVRLEAQFNFCSFPSFAPDIATLTIVDCENPAQTITVTSPMSTAALKGMHEVQQLGAVQTYLRRYLYMSAFEIAETDAVDPTRADDKRGKRGTKPQSETAPQPTGKPKGEEGPVIPLPKEPETPEPKLTTEQRNAFAKLCPHEDDKARLKEALTNLGYVKLSDVPQKDYNRLMDTFIGIGLPFTFGGAE